jgi:hypothetical protein
VGAWRTRKRGPPRGRQRHGRDDDGGHSHGASRCGGHVAAVRRVSGLEWRAWGGCVRRGRRGRGEHCLAGTSALRGRPRGGRVRLRRNARRSGLLRRVDRQERREPDPRHVRRRDHDVELPASASPVAREDVPPCAP